MPRRAWLAAALIAAPGAAAAQQVQVRVPAGLAEAGMQVEGQRFEASGPPASATETRTWLTLPLAGSFGGPGLLSWSLTLRPLFQQRRQSAYATGLGSRALDVSAGARLFGARPLRLSLDAARNRGTTNGGFGTRREYAADALGVGLSWHNRALPMQAAWTSRASDDFWTVSAGAAPLRTVQRQRGFRVSANSSKLSLEWQQLGLHDGAAGDLDTRQAVALHTLRWGRGSRLESAWTSSTQAGYLSTAQGSWVERVHLDHGRAVQSEHRIERSWSRFGVLGSRASGWSSSLSARLTSHLSAGLGASRHVTTTGEARQQLLVVTPRLAASVALPSRWRLTASGSLGLVRRASRGGTDPVQPMVDEPHVVPATRSITLDHPLADPAGVVARSADRTFRYEVGLDYTAAVQGDAVRIDILPGSRAGVGETILFSYSYRVPMPARLNGTQFEADVSLIRGGVEFQHRRQIRSTEGGTAARIAGLGGLDEAQTSVRAAAGTSLGALTFTAALRDWSRGGPVTRERQAGLALAPPAVLRVVSSVAVDWSGSRTDGVRVDARAARGTLAWMPVATLALRGGLEWFRWSENGSVQRFTSLTAGAEWTSGGTTASCRVETHRRSFLTRSTENRVVAQVVRRL